VVVVDEDWAAGVLPTAVTASDTKERGGRGEGLRLLTPVGPLRACVAPTMRDGASHPLAYLGGSAMAAAESAGSTMAGAGSAMAGELSRGWGRRHRWGSPRGARRVTDGARQDELAEAWVGLAVDGH
jgi:hypothetical protein